MAQDLDIVRHQEWLGLLQPVGLVVSPPALVRAQAAIDRAKLIDLQAQLQEVVSSEVISRHRSDPTAWIDNFPAFTEKVLNWLPQDLVPVGDLPESLTVVLPSDGETLEPTYGVKDPDTHEWVLLIQELAPGTPLDEDDPATVSGHGWKATCQAKFERLLKETGIPTGLLVNGTELRLVYAPSGESSGYLTFPVQAMVEVPGRLILGAFNLLLGADRLFNVPEEQRLNRLLLESRNHQAEVSTKLAGQVLDALWELLRGFQAADAAVNGKLLQALAQSDPQHIYGGLITTLMRLVFLIYAEDEGLMPDEEVYQTSYAVSGLYVKLRQDAANYPDTMDQRYGAWARLLSLFRLVYKGGGPTQEYLPARHGQLFGLDEYPFLEGRPQGSHYDTYGRVEVPRIADGVIYRILDKLLILDGERLSYRALDVEQIGSVYEAIMGYEVKLASQLSIGVKPKDIVINIDALRAEKPANRAKLLQDWAECKLTGKGATALKDAKTCEDIVVALGNRVSARTPTPLPEGSLYLQPGEERRRTGSHYTPRKLTEPVVKTTLGPVLASLGSHPTPEQILELKVCDLAMGSAAFLVEACRQLAEKLVEAWSTHGYPADQPDDLEPLLYARRLVVQRCLYGVDKNPFAVNLARLSLWLVTLSKDQPFTFLDHALKCGDSLVGLTKEEITGFGKNTAYERQLILNFEQKIEQPIAVSIASRQQIQASDTRTDADAETKQNQLQEINRILEPGRLRARVAVASFFAGDNARKRQEKREEFAGKLSDYEQNQTDESDIRKISTRLENGLKTVHPFNWELEFPEVFDRPNPGFDAIIGNPPFAGKNTTINGHLDGYVDWLKDIHPGSHGNADIVAHFFRRAFTIVRKGGTFGLIATNTIAQGDTRSTGLRFICNNGGIIYNATRRYRWPGLAAVVVSLVHIWKQGDRTGGTI